MWLVIIDHGQVELPGHHAQLRRAQRSSLYYICICTIMYDYPGVEKPGFFQKQIQVFILFGFLWFCGF